MRNTFSKMSFSALILIVLGLPACENLLNDDTTGKNDAVGTWYRKYRQIGQQRFGLPAKVILNEDGTGVRIARDRLEGELSTSSFTWKLEKDSLFIYENNQLIIRSGWVREGNLAQQTYLESGQQIVDEYIKATDSLDVRFYGKWILVSQTYDGSVVPALQTVTFDAQGNNESYRFEPYESDSIRHWFAVWQVSQNHLIYIEKDATGQPDLNQIMVFEVNVADYLVSLTHYDREGHYGQYSFIKDSGNRDLTLCGSYQLTAMKINGSAYPILVSVNLNLNSDGTGTWQQGTNATAHTWTNNAGYLFIYLTNLPNLTYPYQYALSGNILTLTWSALVNNVFYSYEYTFTRIGA